MVFHQGTRIGELKVSTGLVEKNKLYQETTAGAFFTLEHMSDFSLSGNNYDYVIRYDGGNLLHQCAYRMTKDWKGLLHPVGAIGYQGVPRLRAHPKSAR